MVLAAVSFPAPGVENTIQGCGARAAGVGGSRFAIRSPKASLQEEEEEATIPVVKDKNAIAAPLKISRKNWALVMMPAMRAIWW